MPDIRSRIAEGFPWIAGTIAFLTAGAMLFAWSGLYSVAASSGHWGVTVTLLELGLRSSVRTQSLAIDEPTRADPGAMRLGAIHFDNECAVCHGAPGRERGPTAKSMVPQPPPLREAVTEWETHELFWIVKNGLKYTGMPAWPAQHRDDEVWAVVAFLQRLPELDVEAYRTFIGTVSAEGGTMSPASADMQEIVAGCDGCHDPSGGRPVSQLVPRLAGQSEAYLVAALRAYAEGARPSGMMQPVAASLDEGMISRLAAHYAGLSPRDGPAKNIDPDLIDRGRRIAIEGIREERIPPCLACHSEHAREIFPRLAGQSAFFLTRQLELFRAGIRGTTPTGRIMHAVAQRLRPEDITALARYFQNLRIEETGARLSVVR